MINKKILVESLISSGIEDRTFGPMNLRERFLKEELTLGKNRFLEVASLEEYDFFHFPFPEQNSREYPDGINMSPI